jgi:hypothetical protein
MGRLVTYGVDENRHVYTRVLTWPDETEADKAAAFAYMQKSYNDERIRRELA